MHFYKKQSNSPFFAGFPDKIEKTENINKHFIYHITCIFYKKNPIVLVEAILKSCLKW